MKANQGFDSWHNGGVTLTDDLQPLANYFVRFIEDYRQRGIPIWGVTPQNEPTAAVRYPGSLFIAPTEAQFVAQDLAPALTAAGLHTRIYGNDGGGSAALSYTQTLLGDPGASALSGIAWHCYGGNQFMNVIHEANPGVQQILSECSPGIIPYAAAEAAISGARNWASAILLWNLALDQTGNPVEAPNSGCTHCTGLVTIAQPSGSLRYTLGYYQLGQLSKFVLPGAVRIATERWVGDVSNRPPAHGYYTYGVSSGVDNVAFLNPNGTHVLIAYNGSTSRQRFAVSWHGQSFAYALSPRSTVTFTWR
jgi:glucosylceramidase